MAAAVNQDRNRVAMCSAIFAGFAYVGYAFVRQAFGRRLAGVGILSNEEDALGLEFDDDPLLAGAGGGGRRGGGGGSSRRVHLRRLSGSSTTLRTGGGSNGTDPLFGGGGIELTQNGGPHCILRPMSVRERIRELNLNAMAFADTVLVLQGKKALSGPRSLQSSPFHSPPRILSPIDLHHFPYRDEEEEENPSCPPTPRLSRRASRRNMNGGCGGGGRRSLASSIMSLSEAQQEEADARAEHLLQGREQELTGRLERMQQGRARELTPYESKSLVALLHSSDSGKVARTLVTVANAAAFTRNQDSLREAGVLVRLPSLLASRDREVSGAAVIAAANLALNIGNMKEMGQCVSVLVLLAEGAAEADKNLEQGLSVVECLTNMAVLPDWHHLFPPLLPRLLHHLAAHHASIRLQSLRLLINLTCNDEMIPPLLSAIPPQASLSSLLLLSVHEDELLRTATFLANLAMAATRLGLAEIDPHTTVAGSLQERLFHTETEVITRQAENLVNNHQDPDIQQQARKLLTTLSPRTTHQS